MYVSVREYLSVCARVSVCVCLSVCLCVFGKPGKQGYGPVPRWCVLEKAADAWDLCKPTWDFHDALVDGEERLFRLLAHFHQGLNLRAKIRGIRKKKTERKAKTSDKRREARG